MRLPDWVEPKDNRFSYVRTTELHGFIADRMMSWVGLFPGGECCQRGNDGKRGLLLTVKYVKWAKNSLFFYSLEQQQGKMVDARYPTQSIT